MSVCAINGPEVAARADERHMAHAIRIARRALGATAENPAVGCVIVKDDVVIGTGVTAPGGRPHAETEALAMAGEKAQGATAYVTLEPCSHHGRTPPCTEALADAGIKRVVVAMRDADPRVKGQGLEALAARGVEVVHGVLREEARHVLRGFLSRIERGRPHVMLKLAVSADGMIAAAPGRPTAITGKQALARAHLMRAEADAILVGVGTIAADDPALTCRLPGLQERSPLRVVLDSAMRTTADAQVVKTAHEAPTVIFTTPAGRAPALALKERAPAVDIVPAPADERGRVALPAVLKKLAERGVNRLMVEGGAQAARAFVEAELVDEVALFTAPDKTLGDGGVPALAGLALDVLREPPFHLIEQATLGPDTLHRYERADDK